MKLVNTLLLVLGLSVGLAQAEVDKNFGLIQASIDVGSSTFVSKDHGSLEIALYAGCEDSASELKAQIAKLAALVKAEIEEVSEFTLKSDSPEISISSSSRYYRKNAIDDPQGLNPFYVDGCNEEKEIELGNVDLTESTFSASATVKVETDSNLAKLTTLRQQLEIIAGEFNESYKQQSINVYKERIVVSAEKRKATIAELRGEARLADNKTRLNVDEKVNGGFKELYIASVNSRVDGYPNYKNFSPQLTDEGKSKVTVPYNFAIQYLPKNLASAASSAESKSEVSTGSLSQQFLGEVTVDTDYYVTSLSIGTKCHTSREETLKAVSEPFAKFSGLAQAVKTAEDSLYERVEETAGTVRKSSPWQPFARARVAVTDSGRLTGRYNTIVKSWINICTGQVRTSEPTEEDVTYSSASSLRIITNNFKGLKSLEEEILSFTEAQRKSKKSTRVEASLSGIVPNLKDENLFEVVEILAYESALSQLLDPKGEIATKLLDEISASEAYYTLQSSRGAFVSDSDLGFESANAPRAASRSAAKSVYKVVQTSEGNIPMTEIRVDNQYSVIYRPVKDLVQILSEKRASEDALD